MKLKEQINARNYYSIVSVEYKVARLNSEKGMATHSIILAWRIPWTEEPGGYNPWGHKELDTTERLTLSLFEKTWEISSRCRTLLFECYPFYI